MQYTILITIDVEDWFQVENFRPWIPFDTWNQRELRVEQNTHRLLNLFDSVGSAGKLEAIGQKANRIKSYEARMLEGSEDFKLPSLPASQLQAEKDELSAMSYQLNNNGQRATDNRQKKVQATFFVLGWLAERLPHLVREIHSRGHEVASHGDSHRVCNQQSTAELKKDLIDSKKKLEDIIGSAVNGYRAPNFSIDNDILKLIEDCGYGYDSSYNSFTLHGRYGRISLNGHIKKGIAHQIADNFFELPISNLIMKGRTLPLGGGGYFRLMPYRFFRLGVHLILKKDGAYVFYIHPWEIDPDQPVVKKAPARFKFRHYSNLSKSLDKLIKFIDSFSNCQFITCSQYLSKFA